MVNHKTVDRPLLIKLMRDNAAESVLSILELANDDTPFGHSITMYHFGRIRVIEDILYNLWRDNPEGDNAEMHFLKDEINSWKRQIEHLVTFTNSPPPPSAEAAPAQC